MTFKLGFLRTLSDKSLNTLPLYCGVFRSFRRPSNSDRFRPIRTGGWSLRSLRLDSVAVRIRITCWLTWWLGLLIAAGSFAAVGATPPPTLVSKPSENLAGALWLLEDPSGKLTLGDVQTPTRQRQFVSWDATRGDVNLSYSDSTWWFRVRLQRAPGAPDAWILNIPDAYSKFIDFHAPGVPVVNTGHGRPPDQRPLLSPHFAFPVRLADAPQDFYFRVASHYAVSFPLTAWQVNAYSRYTLKERLLQALYHGALFSMVAYALFIWLSSRDARFGLYAAYGSALSLGILSGNGWGGLLVWPEWRNFDEVSSGLFLSLTVPALILLARSVLRTRDTVPVWLDRVAYGAAGLGAIHALAMLAAVGNAPLTALLFRSLPLLGLLAIALLALISWRVRMIALPGKRYFMLSWFALGLGVVVGALRLLGWVPTNTLTSYAIQISTSVEMLLMSFMLASIIREERQQRLLAQSRLIDVLRAEESRLERSVAERTHALSEAAESERRTLSEYLRFAALVSHEFRNGLNVISAQSDLLRKQAVDNAVRSRAQVISQQVARLAQITDTWLKSDQILNSPSPPQIEAIDCRDWLEKTLQNRPDGFNDHRIAWSVADDATTIWADRTLLEVALMNLVSNACKYSPPHSLIEIQTCAMRTGAGISMTGLRVTDRGEGITPSLQARVFERYFRVRPEGRVSGIGLGLSFVRHIVEQHHGHIDLVSQPGDGSTFTIWLPDRNAPKHP